MWHILKADLNYYKFVLLIGVSIIVLLAAVLLATGLTKLYILMPGSFLFFFISIWVIGFSSYKDKRERHDTLLPLSIRELAISRWLLCVFYQSGLLALWFIFVIFSDKELTTHRICLLFSYNAVCFAGLALMMIYSDHKVGNGKKYDAIIYSLFGLLFTFGVGLAYVGKFRAVALFVSHTLFASPVAAILFSFFALGMYALSLRVFMQRKSYLA